MQKTLEFTFVDVANEETYPPIGKNLLLWLAPKDYIRNIELEPYQRWLTVYDEQNRNDWHYLKNGLNPYVFGVLVDVVEENEDGDMEEVRKLARVHVIAWAILPDTMPE